MSDIRVSEWVWRFLALTMLFTVGWMLWVMYQLNPPPLITNAAFEALLTAKGNQFQKPSAQGAIQPSAASEAPPKPAPAASTAGAEEPPKSAAAGAPAAAEPVKPAPEKPAAEKPVAAKPSAAEIIDTVEAWARAWSSKDVTAYLDFYAKNFKTPGGEARAEWENSRRHRISAPKTITITVDSPNVSVVADDLVNVTFRQGYRSEIVTSSATTKTLVMIKVDGRWLIQQESAGN
jgi:hypothetical protein